MAGGSIAAGNGQSCAIQAGTGKVVCWGADYQRRATTPASVDGTDGTASAIAAGDYYTLAITAPEPGDLLLGLAALAALAGLHRHRNVSRPTPGA